ncbi:hypothetical protein EDL79_03970 [Ehrlichia ruminantium]|uniref:Uncharacterized protein n=1 Tax=Ehrlichia ruminantium TaxID=779 RepID=A0AAE6QB47_EHRRU|nr:hypothetical protein [Ehrlichia ruminantium]QGR02773.1 hypothetical protein EDL81_03960 [Ehrlichia ruminantium]QGR03693.1 hypothetical protein EDL80_03960 [Ehrlichia ruminantium]QGR04620.1 hypothetical protein EDL79_03970 [Ehrlichia ruminantium]
MLETQEYCFIGLIVLLALLFCIVMCVAACVLSNFCKFRKEWNSVKTQDADYCTDIEERLRNVIGKTNELENLTKLVHDLHDDMSKDGICSDERSTTDHKMLSANLLLRIPDKVSGPLIRDPSNPISDDPTGQSLILENPMFSDADKNPEEKGAEGDVSDKKSCVTSDVSVTSVADGKLTVRYRH